MMKGVGILFTYASETGLVEFIEPIFGQVVNKIGEFMLNLDNLPTCHYYSSTIVDLAHKSLKMNVVEVGNFLQKCVSEIKTTMARSDMTLD